MSWGGADGEKPEITQINQTLNQGMFSEIFGLVRENILAGHKIPDPSLIGLPSPTGFSSQAEQLETAYKLFQTTTIFPLQEFLVSEIKPILQLMYPDQEIVLDLQQNKILS